MSMLTLMRDNYWDLTVCLITKYLHVMPMSDDVIVQAERLKITKTGDKLQKPVFHA